METSNNIDDLNLRSAQPLGASASKSGDGPHAAGISDLRTAVEDAFESVELLLSEAKGFLTQQAEQRPEILLACAAGIGFVLGGGLASPAGALLARAGGRFALAQVVHSWWKTSESGDDHQPTRA